MKITNRKAAILSLAVLASFSITLAFAFEWPQKDTSYSSFYSFFGQLRGGTIESSLIFKDSAPVTSAEEGTVACIISEHDSDMGWFESTLGNAVILGHEDQILTVYANLEGSTVPEFTEENSAIHTGDYLGESGNSGWQQGRSCLEFMVIDTKNDTAVNPRILMPRVGRGPTITMGQITLDNKKGTVFDLRETKHVSAGVYTIYKTRQEGAVPFKTNVSINGASIETISFDSLKEVDGRLCATGNSNYSADTLYPDEERLFLAQAMLTPGKNIISISVTDILGNTKTERFSIEVE